MATPPLPPRPFQNYDDHRQQSGPPPLPPLPPDFKQYDESELGSAPHFDDPLAAPRPHKLQPDLPANMARSLHEQLSTSPYPPQPPKNDFFPSSNGSMNLTPGFAMPTANRAPSRGPSPLPPPQGSDWSPWNTPAGFASSPPAPQSYQPPYPSQSYPQSYPQSQYSTQPYPSQHREDSVASSFANLSLTPPSQSRPPQSPRPPSGYAAYASDSPPQQPAPSPSHAYADARTSSTVAAYPPYQKAPSPPRHQATSGPPSLTVPLPTIPALTAALPSIQQPDYESARKVAWCKDVLTLVDRAHHLQAASSANAPNVNSTDTPVGPVRIGDPQLQRLVDVAIPLIQHLSSPQPMPSPIPPHVVEAIYLRATCEASGAYPRFIPHNPRTAFRDFEQAAKSGYHAAWFRLGRDYENFGDVAHAKDCFERGVKYGVESCLYRMGMAHLMGQLRLPPSPEAALPLLQRAATLASVDVPQPAYVYGLLLLSEFSHISLPPQLFTPLIPPGSSPQAEARKHLERAAYLNFSPAQYKLGHSYEFATPPFPFDALLSVQYYSLASQQGEIEADMALSKWFLCGAEGAFEKDESLAWTFAEKSARKGLPSAEFAMGYYAEVGVGGPKDIEAAQKWYSRASQHGNADATERLQALSQPAPQALSRQEHESLTDTRLVRKRTQAKQRSEAIGVNRASVPPAQGEQIVATIRKNSVVVRPGFGTAGAAGIGAGGGYGAPQTGSPPGMAHNVQLPSIDESRSPSIPLGPTPIDVTGSSNSTSPRLQPTQPLQPQRHSQSPHSTGSPRPQQPQQQQGQQRPFANAPRYSLADPGGGSAASSRPGSGPGTPLPQGNGQQTPPSVPRPSKGPQTFAEMGIVSTKAEDKECVIM